MKLIRAPERDCECAVCQRTSRIANANPPKSFLKQRSASSSKRRGKGAAATAGSQVGGRGLSEQPEASTSAEPYCPPIATLLPPEILTAIFDFARPDLPPAAHGLSPTSPSWQSFVRLSLVHSSWSGAAQKSLGSRIFIRSEAQMGRFIEALEKGWVGEPVRELGFEIKESKAGSEDGADVETIKEIGHLTLSTILSLCGHRLEILRVRGFGDEAFLTPPTSWPNLPRLHTFEYSPVDSSAPPTTASIFGWIMGLPHLESLIVSPNSRALAPLESVHLPELEQAIEAVTRHGATTAILTVQIATPAATPTPSPPSSTASPSTTPTTPDENESKQVATVEEHSNPRLGSTLKSFTLSSLLLSSPTLLALLATSFSTLTSLSLNSVHVVGPTSITLLVLLALAPTLREFEWEERLVVTPTGAPFLRDSLSADQYWSVVQACASIRTMRLFGERVFEGSKAVAKGWELPTGIEALSIGSKSGVDDEELKWWLERVLVVLRRVDPQEEEAPEAEGQVVEESADFEMQEEDMIEHADEVTAEELEEEEEEEEVVKPSPEPSPLATSSRSSKKRSWTGSFSLVPPSSASTTSDGINIKPIPTVPTLRSLTLSTIATASSLRQDEELRSTIEEIVDRGVEVTWWELHCVILDTMELTRELRKAMVLGHAQEG